MKKYWNNRNAFWRNVSAAGWLLFSLPVFACELPTWQAHYNISKFGTNIAKIEMSLQHKDGTAHYRLHTEAVGFLGALSDEELTESSELKQQADHSWSLQQFSQQRAKDKERNQKFQLATEADGVHARGSFNGKLFDLQPSTPVWDRSSVQLALSCDLMANPEPRAHYRYTVIDNGKITPYQFTTLGKETIRIADKIFNTLKLERSSGKRSTLLWLDPANHYMPVRLEHYKEDELKLRMNLDL